MWWWSDGEVMCCFNSLLTIKHEIETNQKISSCQISRSEHIDSTDSSDASDSSNSSESRNCIHSSVNIDTINRSTLGIHLHKKLFLCEHYRRYIFEKWK